MANAVMPQSDAAALRRKLASVSAANIPRKPGIQFRPPGFGARGRVWVTKARKSKFGRLGRHLNATQSTAAPTTIRIAKPARYTTF